MSAAQPKRPHKLDLYRLAVQHPEAEVAFLVRAYAHYRDGAHPTRLKEDFCGTAAIAAQWVSLHDEFRALAVDHHEPTLKWAARHHAEMLADRPEDLHLIHSDVLEASRAKLPKVDVVAALNFSAFTFHTRETLRDYCKAAKRSLRPGGMLIIDAYGGPGAMRVGEQTVHVEPPPDEPINAFNYTWRQAGHDAVTGKVDCRIDFDLGPGFGEKKRLLRNAFRYDWRLWTLPELTEVMIEAGFEGADIWCDKVSAKTGVSNGLFKPVKKIPNREDWVAYVAGVR